MKTMGKLVAVVAICVAGFLVAVPAASAAPAPINHGDSTGPGGR